MTKDLTITGMEDDGSLWDLFDSVPKGNSLTQIEKFVLGKESEGRDYRQVVLELFKKYKALKKAQFRRRKAEAEEKILREELQDLSGAKAELKIIEIEEKEQEQRVQDVLVKDAEIEVKFYLNALSKMKRFDRESFEKDEHAYFLKRAVRSIESHLIAGLPPPPDMIKMMSDLGHDPYEELPKLRDHVQEKLPAQKQLS